MGVGKFTTGRRTRFQVTDIIRGWHGIGPSKACSGGADHLDMCIVQLLLGVVVKAISWASQNRGSRHPDKTTIRSAHHGKSVRHSDEK